MSFMGRTRIPQLDAIRGIAILVVLLHNSFPKFPSLPFQYILGFGWMGVDLFFVLSGFLITGILLESKESTNYFRNFYIRRCLRILPLYYCVLFFTFVIVPWVRPEEGPAIFSRSSPWWAYPFFLQNFLVVDSTGAVGPLGVSWSLAIEEQFYLGWAVAVRFCSTKQLRQAAIAVICGSPVLRFCLSLNNWDLYSNVFCRIDGLMAGSLIALAIRLDGFIPSKCVTIAWGTLLVALPLAVVTERFHLRWVTYSLSTAASASLVYLALFAPQKWFQMVLRSRWLAFSGTIGYGLYLLHKIPFDMLQVMSFRISPVAALISGIAASYLLAIVSWELLERPMLGLKGFFRTPAAIGSRH